jgi:CBS domain containing-hemolysin-like protein
MPDGSSSSAGSAPSGGRFWQGLRDLILGREGEPSLRDQIEEAIDEHEDGGSVGTAGDLSPIERQMLRNLLHFGERQVADIAVPRSDIVAFDLGQSFDALVELFREAGHSRMPAYEESLDRVVGMIHVKDVYAHLAAPEVTAIDPRALIRQTLFVPESMGVLDLLARMRAARTHLAIVIDEFGGTDGLVTIEDLVEEIVGDIEDEHDEAP